MEINFFNNTSPYRPKNVRIDDISTLPGKSADELFQASDVIGNYAKSHNVNVRFFDGSKLIGEEDSYTLHKIFDDSVGIEVSKKGQTINRGTWVKYTASDEKPFLRQVYESLQDLVEGKKSRIVEHEKETMINLIKKGKIKV